MARGLGLAVDLEQRGSVTRNVAGPPATGGFDSAAGTVASELSRIGDRIGKLADHAAKSEGEAEGRQAGLDQEFRTRRDLTIRGEAFDRAGLDVAETRLKTALEEGIEGAVDKHRGNAAGLGKAIDAHATGILAHAPEELKPGLGLLVQRKRLATMRQATREHEASVRAEQAGALQTDVANGLRGVSQRAFQLGLDATADEAIAGDLADLRKTLSRRGLDGKPLVAPATAAKLLDAARRDVAEARIHGAFERLETPEQKRAFIDELDKGFRERNGIATEFDTDQYRALRSGLDGELTRSLNRRGAGQAGLREEVRRVASYAEKGHAMAPDAIAALRGRVLAANAPELDAQLDAAEQTLKFVRGTVVLPPAVMDQIADSYEREAQTNTSPGLEARLEVLRKNAREARTQLKSDPLGWAQRVQLIELPPVDFKDQVATNQSVGARIAVADQVARHYGIEAQYLRPDERAMLTTLMAKGGANAIGIASAIGEAAGPKAQAIMAELGKDAPALAYLGSHVVALGGPTNVARDAANGIALMRTEGFKKSVDLGPTQSIKQARDVHQGALGYSSRNEQALIALTNGAYEVRSAARGLKEFNGELWQQTFRELLGERNVAGVTYGGVTASRPSTFGAASGFVVVPPHIQRDGFVDLVRQLQPEDFGDEPPRYEGGQQAVSPADLRRAAWVNVGHGQYRLNIGSDEEPRFLKDASDKPYVVELERYDKLLRSRRSDLFIDGAPLPPSMPGAGSKLGSTRREPPPGMMKLGGPVGTLRTPPGRVPDGDAAGVVDGVRRGADSDLGRALTDGRYDPAFEMRPDELDGRGAVPGGGGPRGAPPKRLDDPARDFYEGGGRDPSLDDAEEESAWETVREFANKKWPGLFPPGSLSVEPADVEAAHERSQQAMRARIARGPTTMELLAAAEAGGIGKETVEKVARGQGLLGEYRRYKQGRHREQK